MHEHGFRVVTVARHPLDVLISILHFCVYESESEHWLLGAGGSEAGIFAAMPRSRAFVEYATGPRAAELLAVTPDWWGRPGVVGVRYEDCVRDTDGELRRMEAAFGPVRCGSRAAAVEACSLGAAAAGSRRTTTSGRASRACGGTCCRRPRRRRSPRPMRTSLQRSATSATRTRRSDALTADRNWVRLVGDEIKETLQRNTEGHRAQLQAKDDRIAELDAHCAELTQRLRESVTLSGPLARALKRLWNRSRGRRLQRKDEQRHRDAETQIGRLTRLSSCLVSLVNLLPRDGELAPAEVE